MEVRAIKDLSQLSDRDFFIEISNGLQLVSKNVDRLYEGTTLLAELKRYHAGRVLAKIAEEEAAKFLILIDAVRCPKQPSKRLAVQLQRFNLHLAKGLYAKASMYRPTRLGQLQEYVDLDRKEFYLDGPNGVDWIFRNEVIDGRESTFYVDYVRHDDGHRWADPTEFEDLLFGAPEPALVRTMRSLQGAGISTPEALATVAELWRATPIGPETHCTEIFALNRLTLQWMESRGQLQEQTQELYQWIASEWQFPMYGLDLSMIEVDLETLRERQRNWGPDDF
jgi:AbiV family abortive infection protein